MKKRKGGTQELHVKKKPALQRDTVLAAKCVKFRGTSVTTGLSYSGGSASSAGYRQQDGGEER